jgi:hypothetical protein
VLIAPTTLLSTLILLKITGPLGAGGSSILGPLRGNPITSSISSAAKLNIEAASRNCIILADSNLCQQSTQSGTDPTLTTFGFPHWPHGAATVLLDMTCLE